MERICGFAVVKKARRSFMEDSVPPQVNGIYYHGSARLGWIQTYDPPYNGVIPIHYSKLLRLLFCIRTIMVTDNLEIAQDILRFVNEMEEEQPNEIIAIYSKEMAQRQDSFEVDLKIDWLGIDIVCGDSMLIEGIFNKPEWFADFIKHLNPYGLFGINSPVIYEYINYYNQLVEQGYSLEKFPKSNDGQLIFDVIRVGVPKL